MTQTVYGILCDPLGHASSGGRHWATPSGEVRSVQNDSIPVDQEHDGRRLGEVIYLERRHGNLWCVAHVDDHVTPAVSVRVGTETRSVETPFYWSAERIGGGELGIAFLSVALTASPARIGARSRPLVFCDGSAGLAAYRSADSVERQLLERAYQYDLKRHGNPLVVQGEREPRTDPVLEPVPPRQRVEVRSAAAVDVNVAKRELDVVIAPAESPAVIYEAGRSYVEVYSHGCFAGCETAPEKVKVNMHHVYERTVGKALHLDPWDEQGLIGTLKLARVKDADEALALADDGLLGISAGFAPVPGGEEWDSRHRQRRVRRALLDHIALTPDPAYETANVLAVRGHELAVF